MNYYPTNYFRKNNSSLDSVKGILSKVFNLDKDLKIENTYKSDLSKFKEELDSFISKYGFEETYIESIEDGMISEKMFYIKSPEDKSFDELDIYLEKIIKHMESFSKYNHLHSFFMNSYIMFD